MTQRLLYNRRSRPLVVWRENAASTHDLASLSGFKHISMLLGSTWWTNFPVRQLVVKRSDEERP